MIIIIWQEHNNCLLHECYCTLYTSGIQISKSMNKGKWTVCWWVYGYLQRHWMDDSHHQHLHVLWNNLPRHRIPTETMWRTQSTIFQLRQDIQDITNLHTASTDHLPTNEKPCKCSTFKDNRWWQLFIQGTVSGVSEWVSSFLTAHQHNKAIQCHSSWMLVKKIYN